MDWESLRYFEKAEFDCQETGENQMKDYFMEMLDELRHRCGFPFKITSGYRSPEHSIERAKVLPGTHADGIAADIYVTDAVQRYILLEQAFDLGFSGIGVHSTFIHVDARATLPKAWQYNN